VEEVAVVAKKHEKVSKFRPRVQHCTDDSIPTTQWGERPHAVIVLKPGHAARWSNQLHRFEQELKTFLRGKIPPFAIPDGFTHFTREEFAKTKTATGKGENLDGLDSKALFADENHIQLRSAKERAPRNGQQRSWQTVT
jgi:acyl-CoA synthetase (AMP-forming)/AMP-acid ligase II